MNNQVYTINRAGVDHAAAVLEKNFLRSHRLLIAAKKTAGTYCPDDDIFDIRLSRKALEKTLSGVNLDPPNGRDFWISGAQYLPAGIGYLEYRGIPVVIEFEDVHFDIELRSNDENTD